jgi:hypothetical protein
VSLLDRNRSLVLATLALAAIVPGARAATLDGAVRLGWTTTDLAGAAVDSTDHSANLSLVQEITPYLRLRLAGVYGEQDAELDGVETFSRSTLQPVAELRYGAPNLSWRVGWEAFRSDSSSFAQEFESRTLGASLSWRAPHGFRLGLSWRDVVDETESVAALGRDLEQRVGRADLLFERPRWSVGYGGSYNELAGGASGLDVTQIRHDLRLNAARDFAGDRLRLSVSGIAGRLEAEESRGSGDLAEPVSAVRGLAGVDLSPALGELDAAPGLVDGDLETPVSPAIEVGGANTFRNVGLDLGLPLPANRLDIVVDRVSGAQVVWDVYQSADGLIWQSVIVVERGWDPDLLRYRLRFPETTERYLKAVNVSGNPESDVRVTELVALRDLTTGAGQPERSSDLYRAAASLSWQISERLRFHASADGNNDSTTVGGVVRRDSTGSAVRGGLDLDLARDLTLAVGYRHSRSEEGAGRDLTRISDDYGASLRWNPLATVDALVATGLRSDSDELRELSNLRYARATVSLDLLDELRLVTDLGTSRIETTGIGGARETLNWTERIEMRPRRNWRVGGGYTWVRTESAVEGEPLFDSSSLFVDFGWTPGTALSLVGTVAYFDETTGATIRQSYNLSWNPGPKLSLALGWDDYSQREGAATRNESLAVHYQIATRLVLFGSLTRSRSELAGGPEEEVTSFNAGTTLSF